MKFVFLFVAISPIPSVLPEAFNQYPQGYYPFEESPAKIPPKVRKPPYLQTQVNCPGMYFSKLNHFLSVNYFEMEYWPFQKWYTTVWNFFLFLYLSDFL